MIGVVVDVPNLSASNSCCSVVVKSAGLAIANVPYVLAYTRNFDYSCLLNAKAKFLLKICICCYSAVLATFADNVGCIG